MKRIIRKPGKPLTLAASLLVIAAIAVGGTLAWLFVLSNPAVNTFAPGTVTGTIVENFDGTIKSNVQVKNEGNIDVYVRVVLVPTWQDAAGNILAESATVAQNLSFTLNTNAWFQSGDYYYHKARVSPGEATAILAETITPRNAPDGAKMNLQVLSEVIQADPASAVSEAWGRAVADGKLT